MTEYEEFPDYGYDPDFVGYGANGCTCIDHMGRLQACLQHPTRMGNTKDWNAMNEQRAKAGHPPLAPSLMPLASTPLVATPRVIDGGPVALRPARPTPSATPDSDARATLRAAAILIPDQPTTEQWQTIKKAILELQHAR